MRFIDKAPYMAAAHKVTDDYLDTYCKIVQDNSWVFQNVLYDGSFRSSGARSLMLAIARSSQENLCCYCMRELTRDDSRVTLEHLIPQKVTTQEFNNFYMALGAPWLTPAEVILTSNFTGVPGVQVPPRPHTVTFENLTASCDGSFPDKGLTSQCCNSFRKSKRIYPLFYIKGIQNEMNYYQDGTIMPKIKSYLREEAIETIEHSGLNCRNLKQIRRLWKLLVNTSMSTILNCAENKSLRQKILMEVLFKEDKRAEMDQAIMNNFMEDQYWDTFMLYKWFHKKI